MRTIITLLLLVLGGAAMAQDAERIYAEGKAYYDRKNYTQAVSRLKEAADLGHKKAQYRLAKCYDKGLGTKENDHLAFQWYMKAAEQGYAKAQYEVGKCYKNGEGTKEDRAKAVEYFKKSAEQDNAEAQLALGKCYMKGKGVPEDLKKAKELFKKAVANEKDGAEVMLELRAEAKQGDMDAKRILEMVK
ncbi:MAG: sel1 repeat family protein [Bacteroidaceae bacterium]|nr:sel1 repeat family protein [Bacteroidaceae bacterium]